MPVRLIVAAFAVAAAFIAWPGAGAQQTPGYSLELYADLLDVDPDGPGDPFSVRRGSEIRYRIEHTVPSPVPDVVYYFETPPGTEFVSADAKEGARITLDAFGGDTLVLVEPVDPFGRVEVTVRVNDVYQGPVTAVARFRGRGPGDIGAGSSNVSTFGFDHGDGVPGQLVADAFVDMNGNTLLEMDDVRQSCMVYVYDDLSGMTVPDDIFGPTDARLPLASMGQTSSDEPAHINLFAGRYSVLFGACDTPLPPSGLPVTTFEPVDRPPATVIPDEAGLIAFEVQPLDVASTEIAEVVRAQQPIGPSATATDLRLDGDVLRWTDRAEGEDAYRVEISGTNGGAFDLPANSTEFTLPQAILAQCGARTDLQFAVTALINGVGGFPARIQIVVAADCSPPITAPNTGTRSAVSNATRWQYPLVVIGIGTVLACAGLAMTQRRRLRL